MINGFPIGYALKRRNIDDGTCLFCMVVVEPSWY